MQICHFYNVAFAAAARDKRANKLMCFAFHYLLLSVIR